MRNETKVSCIFYRNTGEIKGSLSKLEPFLLLARAGVSYVARRRRITERGKGRFIISQAVDKGAAPIQGLILPVSHCRNAAIKAALMNLRDYLVSAYQYHRAKQVRDQAQASLSEVFGEDLRIHPRASLDGFVELENTKGLFRVLSDNFDYVESVRDDPNGIVEPLIFQRFSWPSYGQFLQWYYDIMEQPPWWGWDHFMIYLVFDKTALLGNVEFGRDQVVKPSLDLSRYFVIAPEVITQTVSAQFEMDAYGWAFLCVVLGEKRVEILLSDVYPPFDELLSWLKMLDRCDLPARFCIDEEGDEKALAVFSTNNMSRVLFRIVDRYSDEVFIEGIVEREQLIDTFRQGLLTFFKDEFDPSHWRDDGDEEDSSNLKEMMLADPWLNR